MQKLFITSLILFTLSSCSKEINYSQEIIGKWTLVGLIQNNDTRSHESGLVFYQFHESSVFNYQPNFLYVPHGTYKIYNNQLTLKYPNQTESYGVKIKNNLLYLTQTVDGESETTIWELVGPPRKEYDFVD